MTNKNDFIVKILNEFKSSGIKKYIEWELNEIPAQPTNNYLKYAYEEYICFKIKPPDSNFKIIAESKNGEINEFYIHTFVLNSEYFIKLLYSDFTPYYSININVVNNEVIDILLKYLYTGIIDEFIPLDVLVELGKISDEYKFDNLNQICQIRNTFYNLLL